MIPPVRHVLVIADIEGSSGCWSYPASAFMNRRWPLACAGMTRDVAAVVAALFDACVRRVTVHDFHRTGYNLLPEGIDGRARIMQGYRVGPVPGLGDPEGAEAVMFLGMHAASGTGGFLAHTLTSRIRKLTVNGEPMAEVQLFSATLAGYRIRPIFFSGCPVSCGQAAQAIGGITTWPIDKSNGAANFNAGRWRQGLAAAAVASLGSDPPRPYNLSGPFSAVVTMRDGEKAARQIARRWRLEQKGADILFRSDDIHALYYTLVRICYLTPLVERHIVFLLPLFNTRGRLGLVWARKKCRQRGNKYNG